jgi:hemerythrin-like domain-containing protein
MEEAPMDPIRVWHGEHMRFSRLLDFLEQQMTAPHAGGHPNYELMRDVVHYLHHFADRIHHPREDIAFARLAQRDPEFKPYVHHLSQQHRAIAEAGEALLRQLDDIQQNNMIKRALVEAAVEFYLGYFRHHLATEENKVLPHALKVLTPEDWAAVATAIPGLPDPLFGDDVAARYQKLYGQVTRET